jgi:hypothetical protein
MEATLVVAWIATPKIFDAAREQWYLPKLVQVAYGSILDYEQLSDAEFPEKLVELLIASTGGEEAWTGANKLRVEADSLQVEADARLLAKVDVTLFNLLWRRDGRPSALEALNDIGPCAVPEWKLLLESRSASFCTRLVAGVALRNLTERDPSARRALKRAARSEVAAVRGTAELCLALLHAHGQDKP